MKTSSKISLLFDFFCALFLPSPRRRETADQRRRILIIRTDRLGDFALFAPFLRSIRQKFPADRYHLTLIGNRLWMPLAEKAGDFDNCIPIAPEEFINDRRQRRQLLAAVRKGAFDTVWQWRYFREPWVEGLLALAAGKQAEHISFSLSERHIGYRFSRLADKRLNSSVLTVTPETHEILKNLAFWQKISGPASIPDAIDRQIFAAAPLPDGVAAGAYTVILPGTGKAPECRWSSEKYRQLIALLPSDALFVITGTTAEKPLLEATAAGFPNCRICCDLTVTGFAALIANARIVVGNDTGGIHLAAICGVPSLAVAGAGQPGWFLPYPEAADAPVMRAYPCPPETISGTCPDSGCYWQCHRGLTADGSVPCIGGISPERAAERVALLLARELF